VERSCLSQLARALAVIVVAASVVACASGPKAEKDTPVLQAQPEPPPPPPPPPPPTKEEQAQAEKLIVKDAVNALQNGDEAGARAILERALRLDPANELGRSLMDQINADAEQQLGSVSFRYTVQPQDTLAKLSQRFLNDRYRFYILAKYNKLPVPNRLDVGQIIRIPGTEPRTPASGKAASTKAREPVHEAPKPAPKPSGTSTVRTEKQPAEAKSHEGASQGVTPPIPATPALTETYLREAEACHRRQDLDCEIAKLNQVLALDPGNRQAILKRENAIRLKEKLEKLKNP
jgi:LysM repeat protein